MGARLEALGQVRNVFPYTVNTGVRLSITVPVATFIGETALRIDRSEIPFDRGPDKSGRVYVALNGYHFNVVPDAGITTVLSGVFYWRIGGKKVYLSGIANTLTAPITLSSERIVMHSTPVTAESVDNIGYIGYENGQNSVAGGAVNVTVVAFVNVALYGDYSEPDWTELFKMRTHDHIGMEMLTNDDDR